MACSQERPLRVARAGLRLAHGAIPLKRDSHRRAPTLRRVVSRVSSLRLFIILSPLKNAKADTPLCRTRSAIVAEGSAGSTRSTKNRQALGSWLLFYLVTRPGVAARRPEDGRVQRECSVNERVNRGGGSVKNVDRA